MVIILFYFFVSGQLLFGKRCVVKCWPWIVSFAETIKNKVTPNEGRIACSFVDFTWPFFGHRQPPGDKATLTHVWHWNIQYMINKVRTSILKNIIKYQSNFITLINVELDIEYIICFCINFSAFIRLWVISSLMDVWAFQ